MGELNLVKVADIVTEKVGFEARSEFGHRKLVTLNTGSKQVIAMSGWSAPSDAIPEVCPQQGESPKA